MSEFHSSQNCPRLHATAFCTLPQAVLAVDLKGNLDKNGRMSLIQLQMPSSEPVIFDVFDDPYGVVRMPCSLAPIPPTICMRQLETRIISYTTLTSGWMGWW